MSVFVQLTFTPTGLLSVLSATELKGKATLGLLVFLALKSIRFHTELCTVLTSEGSLARL